MESFPHLIPTFPHPAAACPPAASSNVSPPPTAPMDVVTANVNVGGFVCSQSLPGSLYLASSSAIPVPPPSRLFPHLQQQQQQQQQHPNLPPTSPTSSAIPSYGGGGGGGEQPFLMPPSPRCRRFMHPMPTISQSVSASSGFLQPIPGGGGGGGGGGDSGTATPSGYFAVPSVPNPPPPSPMPLLPLLQRELDPFERAYRVGPVLGKGGFGTVYAGIRNRDGLHVAIKQIAKSKITEWGQVGSRVYSIRSTTVLELSKVGDQAAKCLLLVQQFLL